MNMSDLETVFENLKRMEECLNIVKELNASLKMSVESIKKAA